MEIGSILASQNSGASAATSKLADNFDTFLILLTTQLKNQDPLEPLDSHEFTQQLVQFTGVEQAITMNQNLESLLALIQATQSASAVNYLGQAAEWQGDATSLANGRAEWAYEFVGPAQVASISIQNEAGLTVFAGPASLEPGRQQFVWDGTDIDGNALPDGTYTFNVSGLGADGNLLGVTTWLSGIVDGVRNDADGTKLLIGDVEVPFAKVTRVSVPPAQTSALQSGFDELGLSGG